MIITRIIHRSPNIENFILDNICNQIKYVTMLRELTCVL